VSDTNYGLQKIDECLTMLTEEDTAPFDFDKLTEAVKSAGQALEDNREERAELQMLREDLRGRIAGMLKAVAVAERSRTKSEIILREIESLEDCVGEQLIKSYRHAAARFRDSFRTSFPSQRGSSFGNLTTSDFR